MSGHPAGAAVFCTMVLHALWVGLNRDFIFKGRNPLTYGPLRKVDPKDLSL